MATIYTTSAGASWLQSHPRIEAFVKAMAAGLRGIAAALRYIFFFQWVVDIARWLITTGGNIAESAFLLATVYVTINTVAHQLVLWVLPGSWILLLNQVSVIAFSVLPELIIFGAISVTFDHFNMAFSTRRVDAWVWAILYAVPTLVFLGLTIATISSFVSVEATTVNAPQASGLMLVVRCLAGWSYGMLQMLWIRLKFGRESYHALFTRLRAQIEELVNTLAARDGSIAGLEQDKAGLLAETATLNTSLLARDAAIVALQSQNEEEKRQHVSALAALRDENGNTARYLKVRDNTIASLQAEIDELKEQNAGLDNELVEARLLLARKAGNSEDETEEALSDAVKNSEKYQLVRKHMQRALRGGEKINMKKISSDTGVSYNTTRRYAQSILDSLVDRKSA